MTIAAWLGSLGLGQYADVFIANDIDLDVVPELTDADLERLGLSLGHRRKLLKAAETLNAGDTATRPSAAPPAQHAAVLGDNVVEFRSAIEGERKQVTILFADLVGSTRLIEGLDAEESAALLGPCIDAMLASIRRYQGTVTRTMGDGLVALFGAPAALEDHAIRACYAALDMQRALERLGRNGGATAMKARVGLNSGEVVVKAVGDRLHADYDAIGTPVHLASRMEQAAAPGTIQITAATLAATRDAFLVEALGPLSVKGVSEPVQVYRLIGVKAGWSRIADARNRGLSPLVGRANELATLKRAFERAAGGSGQIVAAVGEPGTGKSRLFLEFVGSPAKAGALVLVCGAVSFRASTPWAPVVDLLRGYFAIEDSNEPARILGKVAARVAALDAALQPIVPALCAVLGIAMDDVAWDVLSPVQRRGRMQMAVKALLLRECVSHPVVVVLEDLHWADEESLKLVESLLESLASNRLLLLVNYRPEFKHAWANRSTYTQIRVQPLGEDGAASLLDETMGGDPSLAPLKRTIAAQAQGNALFLEEIVRSLVERGRIEGDRGAYRLARAAGTLNLPPTVQTLIAARIDRLEPLDKRLLCAASVIGFEVPHALLAAVAAEADDALEAGLSRLKAAEFLHDKQLFPETDYAFRHASIQEVALKSLLKAQQRWLHARVGEAMERLYPARAAEMAEAMATHFAEGERWVEATRHFIRAIERAKSQYAVRRAIELCDRALEAIARRADATDDQRKVLVLLGDLWSQRNDIKRANEAYERARAITTESSARRIIENKVHRQAFATRRNGRVSFYRHGRKGRTILLSSPVSYGLAAWQPVVDRLCQEFRLVTVDSRGTGGSDPLAANWTLFEDLEDMRAVIEELDAGPVTAVGLSHTGSMVVALAGKYPRLVERVVVIGGTFGKPAMRNGISWMRNWVVETGALLDRGDYRGAAQKTFDEALPQEEFRDLKQEWIEEFVREMPVEVFRTLLDCESEFACEPYAKDVRAPTLVVHGTEDISVPYADGVYLASTIPDAIFYPFEGHGHEPEHTATAEFCALLSEFVRTGTVAAKSTQLAGAS